MGIQLQVQVTNLGIPGHPLHAGSWLQETQQINLASTCPLLCHPSKPYFDPAQVEPRPAAGGEGGGGPPGKHSAAAAAAAADPAVPPIPANMSDDTPKGVPGVTPLTIPGASPERQRGGRGAAREGSGFGRQATAARAGSGQLPPPPVAVMGVRAGSPLGGAPPAQVQPLLGCRGPELCAGSGIGLIPCNCMVWEHGCGAESHIKYVL